MNVSILHKFDVFLSYARQDRDHAAGVRRLLEHKGFVSYFPDEDERQQNPPTKIFDAMFDSYVCLLLMASDKRAPWWDESIPDAIRERVARSRGEFRVLSVLLGAPSDKHHAGSLKLPFVTEDLVVGEDSLNDEGKLHELILLIRGARQQPKSFADPGVRAWAKSHAENTLRIWSTQYHQYDSSFDERTYWPRLEIKRWKERDTTFSVVYREPKGLLGLRKQSCLRPEVNYSSLLTVPLYWKKSGVDEISDGRVDDWEVPQHVDSFHKPRHEALLIGICGYGKPRVLSDGMFRLTSLEHRPVKVDLQLMRRRLVLTCCYPQTLAPSFANSELEHRVWDFANQQVSHRLHHLAYEDWPLICAHDNQQLHEILEQESAATGTCRHSSDATPLGIMWRIACMMMEKYFQDLHVGKLKTQGSLERCVCKYCESPPSEELDAETATNIVSDKMVDSVTGDSNSEFEDDISPFDRWQVVHFCLPVPEERIQ